MTSVTTANPVKLEAQSSPVRNASKGQVYKGHVVNTLEEISDKSKLSVLAKKILSITLIVLAAAALVAGICLFSIAAAVPILFASPLAAQLIGLIVLPVILGVPLAAGGFGGLKEVKMIELTERLKKKDEKTQKLLQEGKLDQIPVKSFLGYLNRQNPGARVIRYNTNCKNLGEVDSVFLGDIHSDLRVRKCNTLAVKLLAKKSKERVYVESNDIGLAKFMFDVTKLPADLQYRVWDNQPKRSFSLMSAAIRVGLVFEGIIGIAKGNFQQSAIDTVIAISDKVCVDYPKLKPQEGLWSLKNPVTPLQHCQLLAYKAGCFVENLKKERNQWVKDTWQHRQNHMTQVLKNDEKEMQQEKNLTFVNAGQAHLLTAEDEARVEPNLQTYLESSGRKYIILGAEGVPNGEKAKNSKPQQGLLAPSPNGNEVVVKDFLSLPKDVTLSTVFNLLKIRQKVALAAIR